MKLTQSQLKSLIREELSKLSEAADKNTGMSGFRRDDDGDTYMGHVKDADTIEEETADEREDHNIKDLYAMARGNRKALNDLLEKAGMSKLEIED